MLPAILLHLCLRCRFDHCKRGDKVTDMHVGQVADCEESQRALRCLRCLRCLGGAQLVLLHLDAHLSTRGTAQFLAAAPLLGVAPNELGALEQPVRRADNCMSPYLPLHRYSLKGAHCNSPLR